MILHAKSIILASAGNSKEWDTMRTLLKWDSEVNKRKFKREPTINLSVRKSFREDLLSPNGDDVKNN